MAAQFGFLQFLSFSYITKVHNYRAIITSCPPQHLHYTLRTMILMSPQFLTTWPTNSRTLLPRTSNQVHLQTIRCRTQSVELFKRLPVCHGFCAVLFWCRSVSISAKLFEFLTVSLVLRLIAVSTLILVFARSTDFCSLPDTLPDPD